MLARLGFFTGAHLKEKKIKNSTWMSHQIILLTCVSIYWKYVRRDCENSYSSCLKMGDIVTVYTKYTWLCVSQIGPALLLSFQIETEVTLSENNVECCPNRNGWKRRRQVLSFDVHLSRRTACSILVYAVNRYASESKVHLGMDQIWLMYHSFMDVMACQRCTPLSSVPWLLTTRRSWLWAPKLCKL